MSRAGTPAAPLSEEGPAEVAGSRGPARGAGPEPLAHGRRAAGTQVLPGGGGEGQTGLEGSGGDGVERERERERDRERERKREGERVGGDQMRYVVIRRKVQWWQKIFTLHKISDQSHVFFNNF